MFTKENKSVPFSVLSPDGQITMTGSAKSNGYLKKAIKKIELLGFKVVSRDKVSPAGFKTIGGAVSTSGISFRLLNLQATFICRRLLMVLKGRYPKV